MSAVGIDVGTTAVKGVAIDPAGGVLARAEAEYPFATPRPGWVEQDPEDWWRATETVLEALRSEAGPPAGIGLSGQMHGLVALDSADRVVRPAILWNDQRTATQCREIEDRLGLERLIELTGNRALPGFTAPKLLWLRETEPDVVVERGERDAAQGLRAAAPVRSAGDRRLGCVGDAAARCPGAALELRGARRARARRRLAAGGAGEPGGLR